MNHIIKSIRKIICPECESTNILKSRLNYMRGTYAKLFLRFYRCHDCKARFIGLKTGVSFLLKGMALLGIFMLILSVVFFVLLMASKESKVASADDNEFLKNMKRAEQGEVISQLNVGLMYLNGKGTTVNHHEALRWLEQAAEKGNADALYHLGMYYIDPEGLKVHRDYPRGIKFIKQAAEQGHVDAQYRFGMLYYDGIGVIQDFQEGTSWIRKAAEGGMTDAIYQMGLSYFTGRGVAIDYFQSYVWFNIAAAHGKEKAVKQRKLAASTLTLDELHEAQLRSRNFEPVSGKNTPDSSK